MPSFADSGKLDSRLTIGEMKHLIAEIRTDPSPGNCAIAGMLLVGGLGAIVGLVIGLHVYAATAWAAMFELGIPALVTGAVSGSVVGACLALRRSRRHGSP